MMAPMTPEALAVERRRRVQETFQLDPTVIITIRDKEYVLEITNLQAKQLYKREGINLLSQGIPAEKFSDPDFLGFLFFLTLQEHQPDITEEGANKLLSLRYRLAVMDSIAQCLMMFHPDMSDLTPAKPQEPTEGEPIRVVDPSEQPTPVG